MYRNTFGRTGTVPVPYLVAGTWYQVRHLVPGTIPGMHAVFVIFQKRINYVTIQTGTNLNGHDQLSFPGQITRILCSSTGQSSGIWENNPIVDHEADYDEASDFRLKL